MTINEVLSAISKSLTSLGGRAALDHYPSLRVKTRVLNAALEDCRKKLDEFQRSLNENLNDDAMVAANARSRSDSRFYFRQIVPRMLQNFLTVFRQLIVETVPAPQLTRSELMEKQGEGGAFADFNRLTTSVRQFIDNLVVDAYQLVVLSPKELVHQILSSLISFVKVAPASLQAPIVSPELQAAVNEFSRLSKRQRRNSPISSAQKSTFADKAEYLCDELKPDYHHNVLGNLNTVFSFCSEFTHVGYVPTLIASNDAGGIVLGGEHDAFFPGFENLAELKYRLLRECAIFVSDIYIPALSRASQSLLAARDKVDACESELTAVKAAIRAALNGTEDRFKVQPIAKGLKEHGGPIVIQCGCGGRCEWRPPYHDWFAFCDKCGARFNMPEVSPLNLYALSAQGVGDVIGAAGPSLERLTPERRDRAMQIWKNIKGKLEHGAETMQFAFIGNPDAYDDEAKDISGRVEKVPSRGKFQISAWVAQAAIYRGETIEIECNCGAKHVYGPPYSAEIIACSSCGTKIGIYVLSGDQGYFVAGSEGAWKLYPLFGSIHNRPKELTKEQYSIILEEMKPSEQLP